MNIYRLTIDGESHSIPAVGCDPRFTHERHEGQITWAPMLKVRPPAVLDGPGRMTVMGMRDLGPIAEWSGRVGDVVLEGDGCRFAIGLGRVVCRAPSSSTLPFVAVVEVDTEHERWRDVAIATGLRLKDEEDLHQPDVRARMLAQVKRWSGRENVEPRQIGDGADSPSWYLFAGESRLEIGTPGGSLPICMRTEAEALAAGLHALHNARQKSYGRASA